MTSPSAPYAASLRFLFAEPHPSATPLQQWLATLGACDIVHDGEAALRAFTRAVGSRHPYTATVVASDLPSQSGLDLLPMFRQLEAERGVLGLQRTAICLTTTTPSWTECQRVFRNEGDAYLPVPLADDAFAYLTQALRLPTNEVPSTPARCTTILLVEDHALQAKMTIAALKKHGCSNDTGSIHHASSLADAISAIQQAPPDLILLDLTLPDSRGLDTFEAIAKHASQSAIVILSGSDDDALNAQLLAQGASAVHGKRDLTTINFRQTLARLGALHT